MDLVEYSLSWWYSSGAKTADIKANLSQVLPSSTKHYFPTIGDNDFDGEDTSCFMDIPFQIIALARALRQHHSVKAVYVGKLYYRSTHPKYLPTPAHVRCYNDKVNVINEVLESTAPTLEKLQIIIRNHKGRVKLRDAIISCDGTHFNARGEKFYRSVRGSLVNAKQYLSGQTVTNLIILIIFSLPYSSSGLSNLLIQFKLFRCCSFLVFRPLQALAFFSVSLIFGHCRPVSCFVAITGLSAFYCVLGQLQAGQQFLLLFSILLASSFCCYFQFYSALCCSAVCGHYRPFSFMLCFGPIQAGQQFLRLFSILFSVRLFWSQLQAGQLLCCVIHSPYAMAARTAV